MSVGACQGLLVARGVVRVTRASCHKGGSACHRQGCHKGGSACHRGFLSQGGSIYITMASCYKEVTEASCHKGGSACHRGFLSQGG